MNDKLWNECIEFHGHSCPGLALGFRAAEIGAEELGIPLEKASDEEIVCVAENDACSVDAVQVLFSCTAGKGNLLFKIRGKQAYSFFDRNSGKKVRIVMKGAHREMERDEAMNYILNAPKDEICEIKEPPFDLPKEAKIFNSVECELCKESAREDLIRIQEGKKVCLECFNSYSRSYF
ncbi:MAG: FmdE family protein [Bacilli bacterium]|jgi:formylmethanofuran dehydrogenase subunit E